MSAVDLLRRMSLFVGLRDEELAALGDCLGRRVFAKGMILFHKGSPAQSLYLIESGLVRIFALRETGQEITLDVYWPGECFGEAALLDGNLRSAGAIALERTVVYTLRRNDFLRCLDLHPQVARSTMALLVHRLERVSAHVESLAFLDVAGRVAGMLLEMAARSETQDSNTRINLPLTQSDLAGWCACSREMVNKILRTYRDQGLVTMDGHTIVITDLVGLKRMVTC